MDEYTPTTEQVRVVYTKGPHCWKNVLGAEFDRWLREHDRELSERVWEEAYKQGVSNGRTAESWGTNDGAGRGNPYAN